MMNATPMQRLEKFYKQGSVDECWQWLGTTNGAGYGKIRSMGKRYYAHRLMYEKHKGKIPDGLHVLHSCDNRSCVNPAHLRAGTNKENHDEAWQRDRFRSRRKLSPQDILEIRQSELPRPVVAKMYKIHVSHVYQIRTKSQGDGILKMLT